MPPIPRPAVLSVVLRAGQVLLVRRANPPDAGLWGLPGGKIEPGETLADAALRELFEETGIRADAGPVLTALDAFDRDEAGVMRHHFILIAVTCHWLDGEPVAGDDALEAAWVDLTALEDGTRALSKDVAALARLAEAAA